MVLWHFSVKNLCTSNTHSDVKPMAEWMDSDELADTDIDTTYSRKQEFK